MAIRRLLHLLQDLLTARGLSDSTIATAAGIAGSKNTLISDQLSTLMRSEIRGSSGGLLNLLNLLQPLQISVVRVASCGWLLNDLLRAPI